MFKIIKIFLLILSLQAFAIENKDSLSSLKLALGKFKTVSSSFIQNVHDGNGNIMDESEGYFLLKKPDKFYWETSYPNQQIIVKNKLKLWIYDVDLEQVTIQNIKSIKQFNVLNLLIDNSFSYEQHFNISSTKILNGNKFILETIGEDFDFEKLIITVINDKLYSLEIYDHFDSKIKIKFTKLKYNKFIDENKFSLKIADNIDIIRQ